jgi:hypothetical protein
MNVEIIVPGPNEKSRTGEPKLLNAKPKHIVVSHTINTCQPNKNRRKCLSGGHCQ